MPVTTNSRPNGAATRRGFLTGGLLSLLAGAAPGLPTVAAAEDAPNLLTQPRVRMAHLLRRAGFGATPAQLDQFVAMGYEATVDWLLNFQDRPDAADARLEGMQFDFAKREELKRWWVVRMLATDRPLQEKMTLFWHGLLTSGFSKVNKPELMQQQNELLRAHALGNVRTLLKAVSKDPAMLVWLDGNNSRKKAANENYARELMELFTMGIGNYTEADVKESARAFTGWTVNRDTFQAEFRWAQHDGGVKTFLGQTGRWGGDDIVDIILRQRVTAEYLSRRLFSFFGYRNPSRDTVGLLADVFTGSNWDIKAVMGALLLSDEFSSAPAYRALVKSPAEYLVGLLRTLNVETDGAGMPFQLREMGQDLLDPPNVAGWPGGGAWINSATWLQRVNFANGLITRRKGAPSASLTVAQPGDDPRALSQRLIDLLLDGNFDPARRANIEAWIYQNAPATLTTAFLNRQGRHLAYLLLASPDYQLA